jgi:hypothetical protein
MAEGRPNLPEPTPVYLLDGGDSLACAEVMWS